MLTPAQCRKIAELLKDNLTEPPIPEVHEVREERREPTDVWDLIGALETQAALIDGVEAQPASIVTLKTSANGMQVHWATERPSQIRARIYEARRNPGMTTKDFEAGMIRLTVVRGMKGFDLWTRHDNVSSVEDYR